ncbi:HNH endonuclease [Rhizobium mesoamericanum]|nr:HNH endonuclease [Rhizobium mesoamericanum]
MRSVEEWIGRTDDQKVPDRVRIRVLDRYDHKCYLTGQPIRPGDAWEIEHIQALILGGEHRENNLAPALAAAHKVKTAAEMKVKAKIARVAKKSFIGKKKSSLSNPRFKKLMNGDVVDRRTGEIVSR